MGAITSLEHRRIEVQPGGEATCSVLVRNTGTVVDRFTIEVLGDAHDWSQVDPAMVNLLPDEESTVVVRFRPPRTPGVRAGATPFGVRISSREDRAGTVVEEGTLDVGAFTDIRMDIVPRRPRGRRQARCEVAVDNLGNHSATIDVDGVDADENLRFRPERTTLTLEPATTAFVSLLVRPDQGFLRGPERTLPFQVRASGTGVTPTVAEGAMLQQPLLPKWLPVALAALLAALIALVVLWLTVFKPTIQSAAREAATERVQNVADTANAAKAQAAVAEKVANGEMAPRSGPRAGQPPGPGSGPGDPTLPPTSPTSPPPGTPGGPPLPEPVAFRIAADAPRGAAPDEFTTFESDLPPERSVVISDLVLQNPFGDSGILRILRVGADDEETVLLEVGLNNFRDLDYHFVQPLRFRPGETIGLAVNCQNPPDRERCTPSVSFSGQLEG